MQKKAQIIFSEIYIIKSDLRSFENFVNLWNAITYPTHNGFAKYVPAIYWQHLWVIYLQIYRTFF